MVCPYCGKYLSRQSKACNNCNTPLAAMVTHDIKLKRKNIEYTRSKFEWDNPNEVMK